MDGRPGGESRKVGAANRGQCHVPTFLFVHQITGYDDRESVGGLHGVNTIIPTGSGNFDFLAGDKSWVDRELAGSRIDGLRAGKEGNIIHLPSFNPRNRVDLACREANVAGIDRESGQDFPAVWQFVLVGVRIGRIQTQDFFIIIGQAVRIRIQLGKVCTWGTEGDGGTRSLVSKAFLNDYLGSGCLYIP